MKRMLIPSKSEMSSSHDMWMYLGEKHFPLDPWFAEEEQGLVKTKNACYLATLCY